MASGAGGGQATESKILQSEEVLRAKQQQIRNFIDANYSKILDRQKEIQQVEVELAALQMEAKQTVNPRKQALEFLRRKIEQQGEKVTQARQRELQTKKAYEHAVQVARAEEEEKEKLAKELQTLVQETASSQLERLEQLTRRLEILSGGAHLLSEKSMSSASNEGSSVRGNTPTPSSSLETSVGNQDKQPLDAKEDKSTVESASNQIKDDVVSPQRKVASTGPKVGVKLTSELVDLSTTKRVVANAKRGSTSSIGSSSHLYKTPLVKGRELEGSLGITSRSQGQGSSQWTGGGFEVE